MRRYIETVGVMRMNSGGGEQYARMRARKLCSVSTAFQIRAGHDHGRDADCASALDDLLAIGIEAAMSEIGADV